jgi:Fe-S-cluster containining protein
LFLKEDDILTLTTRWRLVEASFEGLEQLGKIYAELDSRITTIQTATGLSCLQFCKHCCDIPAERIPVTLLEALPLSIHWWQTGQAEVWFKKLSQANNRKERCLLFQPDNPRAWGCHYYRWRPLLCRMFCFSAVLDKNRRPQMMLCKPLQLHFPKWERKFTDRLPSNFPLPVYCEFAKRVAGLNPALAQTYPINQALLQGLEMVGLKLQFSNECAEQYQKTS